MDGSQNVKVWGIHGVIGKRYDPYLDPWQALPRCHVMLLLQTVNRFASETGKGE
jgi:hypothetical protein